MTTDSIHDDVDVELLADKTIELWSVSAGRVIWIWTSDVMLNEKIGGSVRIAVGMNQLHRG